MTLKNGSVEPSSNPPMDVDGSLPFVETIVLTDDERSTIAIAAATLAEIDPIRSADDYVMQAQLAGAAVPARVRQALLRFRRFGGRSGGLLIRGLPIGTVPKTPLTANHHLGIAMEGARSMVLLTSIMGDTYGYSAELGGMIVQNISPVPGREATQESVSSLIGLDIHNETVFTENRADYVALLCVRADHERRAGTTISSARSIVQKLGTRDIEMLRQARWATTVDGSFLRGAKINGSVLIGPIAILEGSESRPWFRCDFAETRPLNPLDDKAASTLKRLLSVVLESAVEVKLEPGDLLLVDNHEAFHGRTAFVPRYDGLDRWLLRSFVTKDLARSARDRPGDGQIIDRDYTRGPEVLRIDPTDMNRAS